MRTRTEPKCCVRQYAHPRSPLCSVRVIFDQSVVPNGKPDICTNVSSVERSKQSTDDAEVRSKQSCQPHAATECHEPDGEAHGSENRPTSAERKGHREQRDQTTD